MKISFRIFFYAFLVISASLYAMDFPTGIHFTLSSMKVPTQRNQLEVVFEASSEGGMYQASFSPYAPGASVLSTSYPDAFWFDAEPAFGSYWVSFPSNGLYQVYGTLLDYYLVDYQAPEGMEVDPYLTSAILYVKVVQGNAIEISAQQYNHEIEKDQREKNEGRALGRVKQELEFAQNNLLNFAIEEGEYSDRLVSVENDMGLELFADNGDIHQKYLESESIIRCPPDICKWKIPFCKRYSLYASLNMPITVSGTILYENPTILSSQTGTIVNSPVRNRLIYLTVRSYVYTLGSHCFGLPEGINILTIKSILYPFYTDETGHISGTIYAAPPWDQGLPYIESVDTRSPKVDAVTLAEAGNTYTYFHDFTPYGTKEPNSIFYPAICAVSDDISINCFSQHFDLATYTLTLDVVFKKRLSQGYISLLGKSELKI